MVRKEEMDWNDFAKKNLKKGAAHTMSSEELAMLPLEPGKNMATYHVPALEVTIGTCCALFL